MWSVVVAAAGWLAGWVVFGRPRRLTPATTPVQRLSVIVPARNEQTSLPRLLHDLEAHAPAGTEVIVVDDQSTDATASIAQEARGVKLIGAGERPAGWAGKPWACHVGAREATAPVLCFLDADVQLATGAIGAVCRAHQRHGGLVSVQPWHRTEQPYERASALFGVVALMGTGTGEQGDPACAYGPVLMTSREDYDAVGGHLSVRREVVEDVALAAAYRGARLPVTVLTGADLVAFRMYPDGVRSMLEGWSKNFASGAASTARWRLVAIVLWLVAMGTALGLTWDAAAGTRPVALGAVAFAAFAGQLRTMFSRVGRFGWITAVAFPLLMIVFFAVFFRSLWLTKVRREVRWRGRRIPIHAVGAPGGRP